MSHLVMYVILHNPFCPASMSRRRPSSARVRSKYRATTRWSAAGRVTRRRRQTAAALTSFSVLVASRYSCTHRAMTVEVFSTLVSCPTT